MPTRQGTLGRLISQDEWDAAKKAYGTTDNPLVIGFILPDGTALDFSGGGNGSRRMVDHRDIRDVIKREKRDKVYYPELVDFVLSGAIRYITHIHGFQIGRLPTEEQWDRLWDITESYRRFVDPCKRIYIDLCKDGDFYDCVSVKYQPKTSMAKIKADVIDFFTNGIQPEGNWLNCS